MLAAVPSRENQLELPTLMHNTRALTDGLAWRRPSLDTHKGALTYGS